MGCCKAFTYKGFKCKNNAEGMFCMEHKEFSLERWNEPPPWLQPKKQKVYCKHVNCNNYAMKKCPEGFCRSHSQLK